MAVVRRHLAGLGPLMPRTRGATAGPARIFRAPGFKGELGFISPMSQHHCGSCNRLRITADGKLRPCLLETLELEVKSQIRQGLSDFSLAHLFREAIRLKSRGKVFPLTNYPASCLSMASIGG